MRSIPGIIEQSKDFVDSAIHAQKIDWMAANLFTASTSYYDYRRPSDSGRRPRPKSASFTTGRGTADYLLASTPELSHTGYSEPPPIAVNVDLFSSNSSGIGSHWIAVKKWSKLVFVAVAIFLSRYSSCGWFTVLEGLQSQGLTRTCMWNVEWGIYFVNSHSGYM